METISSNDDFSATKEKSPLALRTIGEVSEELGVAPHVLRFWESKFSHINPIIRRGRRYYRAQDIRAITQIKSLLHGQGYTIKGAQKFLLSWNPKQVDKENSLLEKNELITVEEPEKPAETSIISSTAEPEKQPTTTFSEIQIQTLKQQLEEIKNLQNDWQKFLAD